MRQKLLTPDSAPPRTAPERPASAAGAVRRHLPAEERREQILRAALSCFGEKGYHAATMDDLVRASGLSKGSLYWHFRSKEEVFLGLFDSFAAVLYGEWDAAAQSGADALDVLRRECELAVEVLSADRLFLLAWAEFLNHPAARERMGQIYATARSKLTTIIERGREAGSLRPGPPAEQIAGALVGAVEGLLLQWLVDPEFELKAHFETAWEVLMGGLRE
jgi:AcrR family transcriptional regulator